MTTTYTTYPDHAADIDDIDESEEILFTSPAFVDAENEEVPVVDT